ncbi:MerR family transcriptional regulator [Alkalihalobacillus sp. FSL R5-0424]
MEKRYTIGEFAKLTGTTVRTLRFYHKKKLLVPSSFNEQGHRLYGKEDLFLLQKIITFKYLNYSLDQIAEFLHDEELNLTETISFQKRLLKEKQRNLQEVIHSLETVEEVMSHSSSIETDVILSFIHTFQQGEERKRWLSSFLSTDVVDALFSLGTQKQYWLLLNELVGIIKTDQPTSERAQSRIMELYSSISSVFSPEIMNELEENAEKIKGMPPFLMDQVSEEIERYLINMQKEMQKNEANRSSDKPAT